MGFAAGVMIAASVWSLLMPSIEQTEAAGGIGWIPAAGGFAIGAAFLMVIHALLPHLNPGKRHAEGLPAKWHRSTLLFTAVTLHNIPEGMSVGLLFGMAGQNAGDPALMGMATALALGIGIQNIPEGAAVSLPMVDAGMSRWKAFLMGALSGLAEPVFGCLVVLAIGAITPFMPWMLAFAAGAMMFVVTEELIPDAHMGEHSTLGTIGVLAGFLVMMILDVALG
jgi:ZIP family zinc transporter